MKFLLDTSVLIPAEPTSTTHLEPGTPITVELLNTLEQGSHQAYVHPESIRELGRDKVSARRSARKLLLAKYLELPSPPNESKALRVLLGEVIPGSHDAVDRALLAAVEADSVDYLVTEDHRLLRSAVRAGLGARVVTPSDAVAAVRRLFPRTPVPPPAVRKVLSHELEESDEIFSTFRTDYPGFDRWLRQCKREHRPAWVIDAPEGVLAGFCILKNEVGTSFGLTGRVLKICSFKISDRARGYRYGELLLKTIFHYADANGYGCAYVTVFPKYNDLARLFEDFGFVPLGQGTKRGELVMVKSLKFTSHDYESMAPLEFHIRYGPYHTKVDGTGLFIVPIQPQFHRLLFPEAQTQRELLVGEQPFGNSIRKAYLCNSFTRQIAPGGALLFYRSDDTRCIECVGVVEGTLVSKHADEIARFVGKRTVYSYADIRSMCRRPVLAILFRQARALASPLPLKVLMSHGVLKSPPQSIVRVRKEGLPWIQNRLRPQQ